MIMELELSEKNALLESVINGRFDFFRSSATYSPIAGACFQTDEKSAYYLSGFNYAPCNGIIETESDYIPSEHEIKKAIEFFQAGKLPFIWWTGAKILAEKKFQFGGILTGIAIDISQGIPQQSSPLLEIKIIQSETDLRIAAQMGLNVFGINVSLEQWHAANTAQMQAGKMIHFLAYYNGNPVGTASLSTHTSSAGIWNLATLPEHRKQGVGSALVYTALAEAYKLQYKQVMAILMPKGMASGLFAKMGFKEVCPFPFYVYGARADELEK